jgi:hypothetical protein
LAVIKKTMQSISEERQRPADLLPFEELDSRGHAVVGAYALRQGKGLRFTVLGETVFIHDAAYDCGICGEGVTYSLAPGSTEGNLQVEATTNCKAGAYDEPLTMTISVPSGRMVFCDSLFTNTLLPPNDEELPTYNSVRGRHLYMQACEAQGLAYGPVLNTCPSVYRDRETGKLYITSHLEDPESIPEEELAEAEQEGHLRPLSWEKVGYIITDLWAYSFMDETAYLAAGGVVDSSHMGQVTVEPGEYTFTHFTEVPGFWEKQEGCIIYATAERTGPVVG